MIEQGDIYWADLPEPRASEPGYRRPVVVIQNNEVNASPIRTVITCVITTTLRRAGARGNVVLRAGEAGLPKPSVVIVSQVATIDKSFLSERIGTLSRARVREILDGIRLITEPREPA